MDAEWATEGDAGKLQTPPGALAPGLYLVATPIGNLEDITLRALRVLRSVDRIACEDTRQTQKLLNHYNIRKPTVSYHLHNEQGRGDELVTSLIAGARIAVVSDAGTPGIADPGEVLVRAARAAGVPVFPVPGANAALSALVASGLCAEQFAFYGFLPSREGQRRTKLEQIRHTAENMHPDLGGVTQIFYEAPHRIVGTLADIGAVFGPEQRVVLARELTKMHEEFLSGTVSELQAHLATRPVLRGEFVVLLDGSLALSIGASGVQELTLSEEVARAMQGGLSEKDALKQVARARGLGKSDAYREWQRAGKR